MSLMQGLVRCIAEFHMTAKDACNDVGFFVKRRGVKKLGWLHHTRVQKMRCPSSEPSTHPLCV